MFTNWLTGTSSASSTQQHNNSNNNNNNNNHHNAEERLVRHPNSLNAAAGIAAPSIMSTPPDVVLEVGPAPSVRFVAHSLVLGMHSGYLRSAIRLDEHANMVTGAHTVGATEMVLYLGNVTADQFAPLLTYMYTGYLDLNVENIFGVLLATHVLHMPRALEICRSFLARAQTEGYLSNNLPSMPVNSTNNNANGGAPPSANNSHLQQVKSNGKIIRPIPSKAALPNFGFLPINMQQQLPLNTAAGNGGAAVNCFKSLQQQLAYATPANTAEPPLLIEQQTRAQLREQQLRMDEEDERGEREEIVVDCNSTDNVVEAEDDDEVEVFIDSQSETENEAEIECGKQRVHKRVVQRNESVEREIVVTLREQTTFRNEEKRGSASTTTGSGSGTKTTEQKQKTRANKSNAPKREKRSRRQARQQHNSNNNKASTSSGLQVAKAPIPASQLLEPAESSKVIVDVASCDGPVRFRRILNTAYGHKPEAYAAVLPERTQQSVSLSFHQQMAKTINQQRQLQHAEESENSESSGGGGGVAGGTGGATNSGSAKHCNKTASNEIYVCVYCKHTFKSQYCYQKHAKRHLNPLSLSCASTSAAGGAGAGAAGIGVITAESNCDKLTMEATGGYSSSGYARTHALPIVPPMVASKQHATELLRREVRPLDMNVQYYPCKTCGSKFPSYYFVHKHRKLCHADEEAAVESGGGSARGGAVASGTEAESTMGMEAGVASAEESGMETAEGEQVNEV